MMDEKSEDTPFNREHITEEFDFLSMETEEFYFLFRIILLQQSIDHIDQTK